MSSFFIGLCIIIHGSSPYLFLYFIYVFHFDIFPRVILLLYSIVFILLFNPIFIEKYLINYYRIFTKLYIFKIHILKDDLR